MICTDTCFSGSQSFFSDKQKRLFISSHLLLAGKQLSDCRKLFRTSTSAANDCTTTRCSMHLLLSECYPKNFRSFLLALFHAPSFALWPKSGSQTPASRKDPKKFSQTLSPSCLHIHQISDISFSWSLQVRLSGNSTRPDNTTAFSLSKNPSLWYDWRDTRISPCSQLSLHDHTFVLQNILAFQSAIPSFLLSLSRVGICVFALCKKTNH